jgi:hypothetical protein
LAVVYPVSQFLYLRRRRRRRRRRWRRRRRQQRRWRHRPCHSGGRDDSLVSQYTRGSVSVSRGPGRWASATWYTRRKRLSFTGQGESLVPHHTLVSVCLARTPGRKPDARSWRLRMHAGASVCARKRLTLCRSRGPGRNPGWRLLLHIQVIGSASLPCFSTASHTVSV